MSKNHSEYDVYVIEEPSGSQVFKVYPPVAYVKKAVSVLNLTPYPVNVQFDGGLAPRNNTVDPGRSTVIAFSVTHTELIQYGVVVTLGPGRTRRAEGASDPKIIVD